MTSDLSCLLCQRWKPNPREIGDDASDCVQELRLLKRTSQISTYELFGKRFLLLAKMPRAVQAVWEAMLQTRCRNYRSSTASSVEFAALCLINDAQGDVS